MFSQKIYRTHECSFYSLTKQMVMHDSIGVRFAGNVWNRDTRQRRKYLQKKRIRILGGELAQCVGVRGYYKEGPGAMTTTAIKKVWHSVDGRGHSLCISMFLVQIQHDEPTYQSANSVI